MIRRRPHTVDVTVTELVNQGGLIGTGSKTTHRMKGRFRNLSGGDPQYKAKVYLSPKENQANSSVLSDLWNHSVQVSFQGRTFNVLRVLPLQSHVELWLG